MTGRLRNIWSILGETYLAIIASDSEIAFEGFHYKWPWFCSRWRHFSIGTTGCHSSPINLDIDVDVCIPKEISAIAQRELIYSSCSSCDYVCIRKKATLGTYRVAGTLWVRTAMLLRLPLCGLHTRYAWKKPGFTGERETPPGNVSQLQALLLHLFNCLFSLCPWMKLTTDRGNAKKRQPEMWAAIPEINGAV